MTVIPTFGGVVTKSETFSKLLHHLREAQSLAAVMAHLHQTEGSAKDFILAKGWLGISEMFKRVQDQIINLAQGRLN